MFDRWKLQDFAPGEGVAQNVFAKQFDTQNWIDIAAPGDVHQALIEAGRIEDPFYDRNEEKCAWMEEREWWYRISFENAAAPLQQDERLLLVFEGLDTFVTLWLDGEELGRHTNMFREAVFDVGQRLSSAGPHTLALCFHPPLQQIKPMPFESWGRTPFRVMMRKAQFGYGWDWGPRLPTIGIWRPVTLRHQRYAAMQSIHFSTLDIDTNNHKALVAVQVDVERFAGNQQLELSLSLLPPDSSGQTVAERTVTLSGSASILSTTVYMEIERPQLWWTHDLGEPSLYTLRTTLRLGDEQLEQRQQEVGIRTLELDQAPDTEEPGTRFFRFVLNGVPIFARGANWIPAHSFVGAISAERYAMHLQAVREANMNMLRVWGGGIYEQDVFYQLCNRSGILIWQDFMFVCAMYPENDPEFVAEVEAEARYQVRRLRNHPCLALWCGNNENQWLHDRIYWDRQDYPVPGTLYYSKLLPQVVAELDGKTPYWPSSPYGGNDYNSEADGDTHNWYTWHGNLPRHFGEQPIIDQSPAGVSFLHYAEDMGRFSSEFGMHASPVYETLRRAIPADQLYYHSPSLDFHNKDEPKNKGDNLMLTITGLPDDLAQYIDYSMLTQAEGLKFGIEHYRRRKPHCSGTLIWQLNDCWPGLSWSIMDYYGVGKAGYFYTRRVYAPVLASFKALQDDTIELWITNDTRSDVNETIVIKENTFSTGTLWEEQLQISVPAGSSQVVWRSDSKRVSSGPDRYLTVWSLEESFPVNRHFFAAIKDRARPASSGPEITITSHGDSELLVHLIAPHYLFYVHLLVADEQARFSDNYFDMDAGESRTIVVTHPTSVLNRDDVQVAWL